MNRESLIEEIETDWIGPDDLVTMLADMSLIAYRSLAHPPSGDDLNRMIYIAGTIRTRSRRPRVVLRKLIEHASAIPRRKGTYRPGPQVRRAAGLADPR